MQWRGNAAGLRPSLTQVLPCSGSTGIISALRVCEKHPGNAGISSGDKNTLSFLKIDCNFCGRDCVSNLKSCYAEVLTIILCLLYVNGSTSDGAKCGA